MGTSGMSFDLLESAADPVPPPLPGGGGAEEEERARLLREVCAMEAGVRMWVESLLQRLDGRGKSPEWRVANMLAVEPLLDRAGAVATQPQPRFVYHLLSQMLYQQGARAPSPEVFRYHMAGAAAAEAKLPGTDAVVGMLVARQAYVTRVGDVASMRETLMIAEELFANCAPLFRPHPLTSKFCLLWPSLRSTRCIFSRMCMLAGDIKRTWADVSTTFAAHGLFLSPPTHGVHQSQTAIPPATKQGAIARAIPVTEVPPLVFSTYQLLLLGHAAALTAIAPALMGAVAATGVLLPVLGAYVACAAAMAAPVGTLMSAGMAQLLADLAQALDVVRNGSGISPAILAAGALAAAHVAAALTPSDCSPEADAACDLAAATCAKWVAEAINGVDRPQVVLAYLARGRIAAAQLTRLATRNLISAVGPASDPESARLSAEAAAAFTEAADRAAALQIPYFEMLALTGLVSVLPRGGAPARGERLAALYADFKARGAREGAPLVMAEVASVVQHLRLVWPQRIRGVSSSPARDASASRASSGSRGRSSHRSTSLSRSSPAPRGGGGRRKVRASPPRVQSDDETAIVDAL